VQTDKSHTAKNALVYLLNKLIFNKTVSCVPPPNENVGIVKYLIGKSLSFVVKCYGSYLNIVITKK
jgi:hypothetical protein